MIETKNPAIDVNRLMERVRIEAAAIRARSEQRVIVRRAPAEQALPSVSDFAAPPAIGLSKPIESKKERLEQGVSNARKMIEVSSRIPKLFRGWFRRQGGFNRAILETVNTLVKNNIQLNKRVRELMIIAEQQHHWLRNYSSSGQSQTSWMRAAAPVISTIPAQQQELRETATRLAEIVARTAETEARHAAAEERHAATDAQRAALKLEQDKRLQDLETAGAQTRDALHSLARTAETAAQLSKELRADLEHAGEHLRNLQSDFDRAGEHLRNVQATSDRHEHGLTALGEQIRLHAIERARLEAYVAHHGELHRMLTRLEERQANDAVYLKGELARHATLLQRSGGALPSNPTAGDAASTAPGQQDDPHRLDAFYLAFENRFRGERSDIKERVRFYLPFLSEARAGTAERPIVDVGCGRGEWLELLNDNALRATGVDMNEAMVAQCRQRNLDAVLGDAVQHLRSLPDESVGAVTGFHIIEHLPLQTLMDLLLECHRVLGPGGLVLFESPNCKNLTVGACNFYIDPTHRNPVFPETAEFLLNMHGFEQVRLEYLGRPGEIPLARDTADSVVLAELLYGAQDFACLARKPSAR